MAYRRTYNPCDDCQYSYSKNNQESDMCKICEFKELLDKPTADVVEVVRCKDCMHSEDESWNNRIWCNVFNRRFNKNGYCSLGEGEE